MLSDIRDKAYISHEDVTGLNFINPSGPYIFRRHYRQGLRSHILEVLKRDDVEQERIGCEIDGIRWYPRAKPIKMFRIFRTRLETLDSALREINRVKITERYLGPEFMARSSEFIVDYDGPEGRDLMLCGFQEYEAGEILDPWRNTSRQGFVDALFDRVRGHDKGSVLARKQWTAAVRKSASEFIQRIKKMIVRAGYVPDLAGIGNLVVSPAGDIKLVDINNISEVVYDSQILLDDRGYPVCDKSIEALYLLEDKVVGSSPDMEARFYKAFLTLERRSAVKAYEKVFDDNMKKGHGYSALQR